MGGARRRSRTVSKGVATSELPMPLVGTDQIRPAAVTAEQAGVPITDLLKRAWPTPDPTQSSATVAARAARHYVVNPRAMTNR